jgi:photosystem II stability/assembly factor-like uncharacterized protein
VCFAAHQAGLSRSEDGGCTWRPALGSLGLEAPLPATSIALSPAFPGDSTLFAGVPGGILRSEDGGRTWSAVALPTPPPFISSLAVSPGFARDGAALAATMEDGVFLTADRGRRWEAWNIGLLDHGVLCLALSPGFERDRTVFAGTESGVFISANGGRFWRETAFPPEAAPALSLVLSPAFERDGTIFAGAATQGIFVSHDRGQSWQPYGLADTDGAVNALMLAPDFPEAPHALALLDDSLLVTRDGGRSWSLCLADGHAAVSAVAAPLGLATGDPLLVGLVDGSVRRCMIV